MFYKIKALSFLLLILYIQYITGQFDNYNQCPNYFQYYTDYQNKRVDGSLIIPFNINDGNNVLNIIISIGSYHPLLGKYGAELVKSEKDIVEDAINGFGILYKIYLPQGTFVPFLKSVIVNNIFLCGNPIIHTGYNWQITKVFHLDSRNSLNSFPNPRIKPKISKSLIKPDNGLWLKNLPFICGTKISSSEEVLGVHTIFGGVEIEEAEFPWLVLLIANKGKGFCGASLISSRYVLTAGHCVKGQNVEVLEFGRHHRTANEGIVRRQPRNIILHDDFMDKQARGDVALISFDPITFTETIAPICIWPFGKYFDKIRELRFGTVAGWGRLEDGSFGTVPMKTHVNIVDLDMCRDSHRLFRKLAQEQTFCAGGNNTGPCQGDSGGGFYIRHKQTIYLRGIVSTSIVNSKDREYCLTNYYAVYVDISYYLDWLKPYLST